MWKVRATQSNRLSSIYSKTRHHAVSLTIGSVVFPKHPEQITSLSLFFSDKCQLLNKCFLWDQSVSHLENIGLTYATTYFYNPLETTELGSKKELKSMPFITYLSGLLTAQMLSDDQLISGVEIRCEEKGRCPSTCHLCRRPGKEQLSPTPVLLEINRVVPLYTLIQDNGTKEVSICGPGANETQPTLLTPVLMDALPMRTN